MDTLQLQDNKIRANIKHWPANEEPSKSYQHTERQRQLRPHIELQPSQPQKTTIDVIIKHYNELWGAERQTINHDSYLTEVKQLDLNKFEPDQTLITITEITEAIHSFKGKSEPGTDRLPIEVYVEFCKQLAFTGPSHWATLSNVFTAIVTSKNNYLLPERKHSLN